MQFYKQTLPALFFITLIVSCARPLISNLEKGTYNYVVTTDDVLSVSVSPLPLAPIREQPEKPKTLLDLRDSLPHLFLKLLSGKVDDPDKLISYFSKPLSEVPQKSMEKKQTDYLLHKIRLSFSNLKKYYNDSKYMHPNTRLEYLTTTLTIPPKSPITFYNIDKLENEFDEIDLGTLSRDQTVTLNAKIAGEMGLGSTLSTGATDKNTNNSSNQSGNKQTVYDENGNAIGIIDNSGGSSGSRETNNTNSATSEAKAKGTAELGYLNTTAIKEAIAVKLKRLRTGFNFSQNDLTIAQRGRPLGDISDNIYVTATLMIANPANAFSLHVYDFDRIFSPAGAPVKADEVTFSTRTVNFVPCDNAENITLTVAYEGAIRAPGNTSGNTGANALEYDDKVTFYKFGKNQGNPLDLDKNLYCKNAYKITAKDAGGAAYVLKIAAPVPEELNIFADDKPELFVQWLLEQLDNPIAANLATSKFSLYFENIANKNKVYLVKAALTAADIAAIKTLKNVMAEKRLP